MKTRIVLAVAFIVAFALRMSVSLSTVSAHPQEIRYISIASGILSGEGFVGLDARFPDLIQPPLFPLVLAASMVWQISSDLAIARAVAILAGALLVFPTSILAFHLFGSAAARRAALLVALHPLLTQYAGLAMTESGFALLVTSGALFLWQALNRRNTSGSLGQFVLTGIALGLAFLMRPEGLAYLVAAILAMVISLVLHGTPRKTILSGIACTIGGFALFAGLYLGWLHSITGQWLLAPKAVLVQVHNNIAQKSEVEQWEEEEDSVLFMEHVKFGLNASATAIRSHEEFASVRLSLSEGFVVSEEEGVQFTRPGYTVRVVVSNLRKAYVETLKRGLVMPLLMLIMGALGLLSQPWDRKFLRRATVPLAFVAGSFSFLLTQMQSRFLYASIPFALLWVAKGWGQVEGWTLATIGMGRVSREVREKLASITVAAVILFTSLLHLLPALQAGRSSWKEQKELGRWVKDEYGPGQTIMATTPVISYYADADFEVLPYAELSDILRYANYKDVDLLVADASTIRPHRPQLRTLLNPWREHSGLQLVNSLTETGPHAIHIYKVIPHDYSPLEREDREPD